MKSKLITSVLAVFLVSNMFYTSVQASEFNKEVSVTDSSSTTAATKEKIMDSFTKNENKRNYKKDEVLVKVKLDRVGNVNHWLETSYPVKVKRNLGNQLTVVTFDSNRYLVEDILSILNKDSNIEYVEPNYSTKIKGTPSAEPYYKSQWGLKNQKYIGLDINVESAWQLEKNNADTVVGVIDTGIDYNHEDLNKNLWINKDEIPNNGKDDDNNNYIDDYIGWNFAYENNDPYDDNEHGTHVSGIVSASNNGIGTVGVSPNTKIMALKVGDADGNLYNDDIVAAINYGVKKGAKIFNCSFSGEDISQVEYDTIKNSNALFVVAAGNEGNNNDLHPRFPSNYELPNILSVGSIDSNGSLSYFSNYGAKTVDIAAPGSGIYSTIPNNRYDYFDGTSMAAPHVSGVAALMLSEKPELTPVQMKDYILQNARPISQLSSTIVTGGVVDAGKIMSLLTKSSGEEDKPAEQPVQENGWVNKADKWYFYKDGQPQKGWQFIEEKWYYFNEEGVRNTGWQYINKYWYYLEKDGIMATGWKNLNGYWYYLHPGGDMAKGWLNLNGYWYYLHPGGDMAKGWLNLNGYWYYLHPGGDMAKGWLNLGNYWYYLHPGGDMAKGFILLDGKWYYLHEGGDRAVGWRVIGTKKYYFYENGVMAVNTTVGGVRLGSNGAAN